MEPVPPRLLIVDDDADIRSLLADHLCTAGFDVEKAADGQEMRRILARGGVDLIVLDLNLPKEDGLSLCRDLRSSSAVPVIMLTARGAPIDRIVGLEMGADDYMAKPFEPRELTARIRSVLRRAKALPANLEPPQYSSARFAGWTLDLERRELRDPSGRIIMLSGSEYRLLSIFLDQPNRVLTRDQLVAMSGGKPNELLDRSIDLKVSRLRRKLGAAAELIKTVRNEGYVLACAVERR